jgi:uncharacterized protein YlxW (UPF0749 family)
MSDRASGSVVDRAEGLLDQLADTALDDDYYVVRAGRPEPSRSFNTTLTAAALGVFALMVTITAVQTATNRPATEREQQALAQDVAVRRSVSAERRDTVDSLRAEVKDLAAAAGRADPDAQKLNAAAASSPVQGPGVRVSITPAADDGGRGDVSDSDLQVLVNALWFFGAEAVSVNDQRIGTLTSIRTAGEAVTVNYVSVDPPYVLRAIGDVDTLGDRLDQSLLGQDWKARAADTGLTYDVSDTPDLQLPAVPAKRQKLSEAVPAEKDAA